MDTTASARAHLKEYILDDPLGLQRITASALLGGDYGERDHRILRSIILALISHNKDLQAAAYTGIASTSDEYYAEDSARLYAVGLVCFRGINAAKDFLAILDHDKYYFYRIFDSLGKICQIVSSVVSADPDIRQDVETLLTELNP